MSDQMRFPEVPIVTKITTITSLASMNRLVQQQQSSIGKAFIAGWTLKSLNMPTFMTLQLMFGVKEFPALLTRQIASA
jgi:hypothetical protein